MTKSKQPETREAPRDDEVNHDNVHRLKGLLDMAHLQIVELHAQVKSVRSDNENYIQRDIELSNSIAMLQRSEDSAKNAMEGAMIEVERYETLTTRNAVVIQAMVEKIQRLEDTP